MLPMQYSFKFFDTVKVKWVSCALGLVSVIAVHLNFLKAAVNVTPHQNPRCSKARRLVELWKLVNDPPSVTRAQACRASGDKRIDDEDVWSRTKGQSQVTADAIRPGFHCILVFLGPLSSTNIFHILISYFSSGYLERCDCLIQGLLWFLWHTSPGCIPASHQWILGQTPAPPFPICTPPNRSEEKCVTAVTSCSITLYSAVRGRLPHSS